MVVVWVRDPLVPRMVTVAAPTVALPDAVKLTVLLPVVEAGLKLAVTPEGKPLTLSATLPVNPPIGVTVIELVTVPPCATETLEGFADNEKFWAGVTVRVIVVL